VKRNGPNGHHADTVGLENLSQSPITTMAEQPLGSRKIPVEDIQPGDPFHSFRLLAGMIAVN
jgi:hypothetical protein